MRNHEALDFAVDTTTVRRQTTGREADLASSVSSFATLCHLTPIVLAARIPKLAAETRIYSPLERRETRLAVVEKIGAALEGLVAFQGQLAASMLTFNSAVVEGKFAPGDYFDGIGDLTTSTLKPLVDRLQSNADRLG